MFELEQPSGIGGHRILRVLGEGGMGVVYEAWDPTLERAVALKVLRRRGADDQFTLRFSAEARLTAQLQHPSIVPVHAMGTTDDGAPWFVMKKVEGRSLDDVLRALADGDPETTERWTRRRLLGVFVRICQAVEFAHERGALHRDLKPANIMLGRLGEVLVLDWGIARLSGPERAPRPAPKDAAGELSGSPASPRRPARLLVRTGSTPGRSIATLDGATMGTPGWMSPEQARGDHATLDARSDIWALGAILYQLLTLRTVFGEASLYALMAAPVIRDPVDPRERAPDRGVPAELAELCMGALARDPDDRPPCARVLADGVDEYLEGSRRREEAQEHVGRASEARRRWNRLSAEVVAAQDHLRELEEATPPWTPLPEKQALFEARTALAALRMERVEAFEAVLALCERAMARDPGNALASELLADVWRERFDEAERLGNTEEARSFMRRLRVHDVAQRHTKWLRGTGAVSLTTDPPGAEVICQPIDRAPLVWTPGPPRSLGRTPLQRVPLEMGSWLLRLEAPGRLPVTYPVFISRGHHHDASAEPVALLERGSVPDGMVYVPAGPFLYGGDPGAPESMPGERRHCAGFLIARLQVTMREWAEFINALHAGDPEAAWIHVPRGVSTAERSGGQYWRRPGPGERYVVPEIDADGDRWDPDWAVSSVSWHDVMAYVRWRRDRDGLPWDLPSQLQWEKAARGADGRAFPWGDTFEATLCKMRYSHPTRLLPEPVGTFPHDRSVYGVQDLAGSFRDWCRDKAPHPDRAQRVVRGGSWNTIEAFCRLAGRHVNDEGGLDPYYSFRLVLPLP